MMRNLLLFMILCVSTFGFSQKTATPAAGKQYKVAAIGFYNLENFYDTVDDTLINDQDFLPNGIRLYNDSTYKHKRHQLATVISKLATEMTPDGLALFGVAEIENRSVLEALAAEPEIAARNYKFVHYDSPDGRGVDVALAYNPKYFTPIYSRPINMTHIYDGVEKRRTRDILYVKGLLDGDTIHVLVNHWPSRGGGEAVTAPLRNACALECRTMSDSIMRSSPLAKIFVMGDLNDDPESPSCAQVMRAKKKKEEVSAQGFYNPMWKYFESGIGTIAYQDAWGLFDQIMISYGTLAKEGDGYHYLKTRIFNEPFLTTKTGRFKGYPFRTYAGDTYAGGYSDHFPVYMFLVKETK